MAYSETKVETQRNVGANSFHLTGNVGEHQWHRSLSGLQEIEKDLKKHISQRNLDKGVWRAFATHDSSRSNPRDLWEHMNLNTEFNTESIYSFLKSTEDYEHIVGKYLTKNTSYVPSAYMDQNSQIYQDRKDAYIEKMQSVI